MHQGMEKGRTKEEQGELFGVQNIFKFDPNGFVPGRVSLPRCVHRQVLTGRSREYNRRRISSWRISLMRNTRKMRRL